MKNVKGDDGAEREAIVAWLRGLPWYVELSPKHVRAWKPKALADAIERGDHLAVRSHIIGEDK